MRRLLLMIPASVFILLAAAREQTDSVKIIALLSKKKGFFREYTVDSLVRHLQLFNDNPAVRYVRCTEDDTRTGFYADFIVKVDIAVTRAVNSAPIQRKVSREEYQMVGGYRPNLNGQRNGQLRPLTQAMYEPTNLPSPGSGECRIVILQKEKLQEKVTEKEIETWGGETDEMKARLLIDLIHYLQDHFRWIN